MRSKNPARLTAAAVGLLAFASAPAAGAATLPTAEQASRVALGGQSVQVQKCYHYRTEIKLARRSGPGRSYHFKGWLAKNKRICINKGVNGGSYRICDGGRTWAHIAGTRSWVAARCLAWDE
ncbi:hypothetical protein ACGF4C_39105 [Streptomyces sp. NPDC048197]|uniref:hypothetical protein n=1 Tax=Streptomyces sp. NPDC048197 TaxID=3365511 RepID=UPI00371F40D6